MFFKLRWTFEVLRAMKFNIKVAYLFITNLNNLIYCSKIIDFVENDENSKTLANVIHEVIMEYFVKPNVKFDFHYYTKRKSP